MLLAGGRFKFLWGPLQSFYWGLCVPRPARTIAAVRLQPPAAFPTARSWLCCHVSTLSGALSDGFPTPSPPYLPSPPLSQPRASYRALAAWSARGSPGATAHVRPQLFCQYTERSRWRNMEQNTVHLSSSITEKNVLPVGTGRKKSVHIVWHMMKMSRSITFWRARALGSRRRVGSVSRRLWRARSAGCGGPSLLLSRVERQCACSRLCWMPL